MTETKHILKVPADAVRRKQIRESATELIQKKKVVPPIDFKLVAELADELIANNSLSQEYHEFAMVVCGNEVWRDVVAATPFNRRLLLLPQCLKNNSNCEASFDKLGLICAGCRNCQIDEILTTAEELGYSTLVAEGTTVAVGLVEEGSIDAVVGVSCMSVLEKSFAPVSRAAVPVIGIPLLNDGCENTEVDKFWLLKEIKSFMENHQLKPLSVSLLKDKVGLFFSEENLRKHFNGEQEQTRELAIEAMMQGGQRMRPVLAAMAYSAYAETFSEETMEKLAVIIESFHKASLIHDDIEDQDDFRYDKETLHKTHGVPVAINTGDYLIGKGYEILAGTDIAPVQIQKALKLVSGAHVSLSVGQGADLLNAREQAIVSLERLIEIFRKKTGSAVKVAVLLGAIVGGAEENELEILEQFSDYFGIAYQLRDDLNEFKEQNPQAGNNDYPFIISLLKDQINKAGNGVDLSQIQNKEFLLNLIEEKKTITAAEAYLEEYVQKIYQMLDGLTNIRLKLALYGITGKIFDSEKK